MAARPAAAAPAWTRGTRGEMLVDATARSTLGELTDWALNADRALVF
jgi:sulfur relay (sulfurtransferase) complex TusBCD TusD component (DsrE family)